MVKKRKLLKQGTDEVAAFVEASPAPQRPRKKRRLGAAGGEPQAKALAHEDKKPGARRPAEAAAVEAQAAAQPPKKKRRHLGASGEGSKVPAEQTAAGKARPAAKAAGASPAGGASPALEADAAKTVFVDGVPYHWTVEKLEEFFSECGGIVSVRAPTWQDSGRLRGFAHVTFATAVAWKKALAKTGAKVTKKARYLKIEPAKEAVVRQASVPTTNLQGKRRLFVKNLPYDVTEGDLSTLFAPCGKVREIRVPTGEKGHTKGFAFVEFAYCQGLEAVFKMEPRPSLRGRVLVLDADVGNGPRKDFGPRSEAYDDSGQAKPKKRKGKGKGKSGRTPQLQLF